jgi:arsenate reductase
MVNLMEPEDIEMNILFVCVGNSGRSQMAEALAKKYGLNASSAGTMPAAEVNPTVVKAMGEKGIDISMSQPKPLTAGMITAANLVVTMGCSVQKVCPTPMFAKMQKKLIDWNLEDPKGKPLDEVRRIRDDVERRVIELSVELGSNHKDLSKKEGINRKKQWR